MKKDINQEIKRLIREHGIKQILNALIENIMEIGDEDYLHKLAVGLTSTLVEYENRR